jgi:sterol 24-C-methyltransferase
MSVALNNPSEEVKLMRKLHGNLVLEESGFLKKVTQKDSTLNKKAADTYYSNWKDKQHIENNEEHVENRREHAQVMTNAFYDLVTDFYEYGMQCGAVGFLYDRVCVAYNLRFFFLSFLRLGSIFPLCKTLQG